MLFADVVPETKIQDKSKNSVRLMVSFFRFLCHISSRCLNFPTIHNQQEVGKSGEERTGCHSRLQRCFQGGLQQRLEQGKRKQLYSHVHVLWYPEGFRPVTSRITFLCTSLKMLPCKVLPPAPPDAPFCPNPGTSLAEPGSGHAWGHRDSLRSGLWLHFHLKINRKFSQKSQWEVYMF